MEEIKVGEYVRTKDGVIGKVIAIANMYIELDTKYYDTQYGYFRNVTFDERITKHSLNIIDLIEVGDIATMKYRHIDVTKPLNETDIADLKSGELKLVSVVTHQQFNSIKYEVI